MGWLIAQRRQESLVSYAVTGRGDHPSTKQKVSDGSMQINETALYGRELICHVDPVWWP